MLAKIKTYALAALGVLTAVFYGLFYREKAKYEESLRKGINEARETEKKATSAMVEGLENEENIKKDNDTNLDRFY